MTITVNTAMVNYISGNSGSGLDGIPITYAIDAGWGSLGGNILDLPFGWSPNAVGTSANNANYIRLAFSLWDDVVARNFAESPGNNNADVIMTTVTNLPAGTGGVTYHTFGTIFPDDSDVFLGTVQMGLAAGAAGAFRTAIHEIGHALGLNHPGDYDASQGNPTYAADAIFAQDTAQYSIMSYFNPNNYDPSVNWDRNSGPQTPMIYDILAIQQHYGVATDTRLGDTVYGFNSTADRIVYNFVVNTAPILTIYDSGGWDTLDVSGYAQNQLIDLTEGSYSNIGGLVGNVGIAFGSFIERGLGGSGDDTIIGNQFDNHIGGNGGNDLLYGGLGNDLLYGGAGDDVIRMDLGSDYIDGGDGFDTLWFVDPTSLDFEHNVFTGDAAGDTGWVSIEAVRGSVGGDNISASLLNTNVARFYGDAGDDGIHGGAGNDDLRGDDGNDVVEGNGGDDLLSGGNGNDRVFGAIGNDVLRMDAGADFLDGGDGFDTLWFTNATTMDFQNGIFLGDASGDTGWASIEAIRGSTANDTIVGTPTNANPANFYGDAGDDFIGGGAGNDDLHGDAGTDVLQGHAGNDYIDGGAGFDTLLLENAINEVFFQNTGWTVDLASHAASRVYLRVGDGLSVSEIDTVVSIENVIGTSLKDVMFGSTAAETLWGQDGDDTLVGDSNIFAQVSDTLKGGNGNDSFYADFTDVIEGNNGIDNLYAVNDFDWTINLGSKSIEWMQAGFGKDYIDASTQTVGVTIYGSGGGDTLIGSAQADMLWSGVDNDNVDGGAGDDVVVGDLGIDVLAGGNGNDRVYVDAEDFLFDGGNGSDAIYLTTGTGMSIDMAATHFEWVGDVAGGNDTINASAMTTGATIYAGLGVDVINGGSGNDFLWGEAGNDTISGGIGADTLVGGTGADILTGGTGIDTIYANSGSGGDGSVDRIIFNASGFGTDFVYDFEHGTDKLNVHGTGATAGSISIVNVGGHAQVHVGSDLIVVVGAGTTLTTGDFIF